jgi:hypothetical protein
MSTVEEGMQGGASNDVGGILNAGQKKDLPGEVFFVTLH